VGAPRLEDAIYSALRKQPTALIVDLTEVDFLASIAMEVLVVAHREITPTARFGVVADGPGTSRPMKVIGVDNIVRFIKPSVRRWQRVSRSDDST
jgi:anti-sigma B factor antagonist